MGWLKKVLCSKTIIASHGYKVHFVKFMRVYGSKLAYEVVAKAAGQSPLSQNGLVKINSNALANATRHVIG